MATTPAVTERRARVAELAVRHVTHKEMARQLGVSKSQITRDVQACRELWQERSKIAIDALVAEELAKLDALEKEAWEAFERSKQPSKSETTYDDGGGTGNIRTQKTVNQRGDGDRQWLDVVLSCVDRRLKLLGADAPSKVQAVGADGEPLDLTQLTVIQLEALAVINQVPAHQAAGIIQGTVIEAHTDDAADQPSGS